MPTPSTPHPVDIHVGARLRLRRKLVGLSQQDLAYALGLTFQQIQKYERGANRMSASALHQAALTLRTPVPWLFDGLPPTHGEPTPPDPPQVFMAVRGGFALAALMAAASPSLRARILGVLRATAGDAPSNGT